MFSFVKINQLLLVRILNSKDIRYFLVIKEIPNCGKQDTRRSERQAEINILPLQDYSMVADLGKINFTYLCLITLLSHNYKKQH